MYRSTALMVFCGSLLALGACKRAAPPPAPVAQEVMASAPAPDPAVAREPQWSKQLASLGPASAMGWREVEGRCEWSVFEPPQFAARVFLHSPRCPYTVVWHKAGGQSVFAIEGEVFLHDWKAAKVSSLGHPPASNGQPDVGFSNNGTPRVCSYEERSVGSDASASAEYWIVWEPAADGTWHKASERLVDYEQMSTETCSGPLDSQRTGTVYYNPQARVAHTCADERTPQEVCPSDDVIAQVQAQAGERNDGVEYLALSPGSFIAYPYVYGDAVHVLPPVFAIDGGRLTKIYDRRGKPPHRQWDIVHAGNYFLVRDESDFTLASIFERGSVTPRIEFPDAAHVVWIPGSVARAPVIEMPQ